MGVGWPRACLPGRGILLMAVIACLLCSPLRGMDFHCEEGSDDQTCTGVGGKLETCLSGVCLSVLNETGLTAWLQCARGHGPRLDLTGGDLSELSVPEIGEALGVPLQDARVVNDLLAHRQRCRGAPESSVNTEKEMGAGTLDDVLSTFYQGRDGEVPDLLARLAMFESVVCAKCERRGIDCRCGDEDESPMMLLREYASLHAHWNDLVRENGKYAAHVQYIVVQLGEHEGVGNQMLKMITGLIFALNMRRALVVQSLTPGARSSLDPVIDFFTEYPNLPLFMYVQLDNPSTLDSFMCQDVDSVWSTYHVLVLRNAMQAPHIFLNNPHFGSSLRKALLDLPVFFLSHFFWSGAQYSSAVVVSLPRAMPWDGLVSFDALSKNFGAIGARVVGFHLRTGAAQVSINSMSAVRFIQYDHAKALQDWNKTGQPLQESAADFCDGHPASMEPVYECFMELLEDLRGQDAYRMTVVLWASDQGPITLELQHRISALENVCVVQILHEAEAGQGTNDVVRKRDSGLYDMELLGLSEFVLGGTGSTFSYLAHARGLAVPKYSAFLKPGGPKCAAAGGTEAGLITAGKGYDQCSSSGGFDVGCKVVSPTCVGVLIQLWKLERCLQDRAVCWNNDLEWLKPFLVDVEYVRYFQSFLMRMRGVLRAPANSDPMYYPSCYPEPHWT